MFGQLPGWKSDTTGKGPHGTHISGKHGLADCEFVTSLLYSSGFFLLLLKTNSFEQWPSISDYMIYFIFFIILEDWIYFRDNKIVRWFHKKNLHQILQTFRYFPNVFDGKSQYFPIEIAEHKTNQFFYYNTILYIECCSFFLSDINLSISIKEILK